MSHVVPPILLIKLGIVLKLYQILLSKTQENDNIERSTARADQEKKLEWESEKLLEKEAELPSTFWLCFYRLFERPFRVKVI